MASVGHLPRLVARHAKVLKAAWRHTAKLVQDQLPPSLRPTQGQLQPLLARSAPRQPIHPAALLKQSKGRWYSTHSAISATVRRFTTSASRSGGVKYDRSSFPRSRIGDAVNSHAGRTPFASTLRPNLTGGTLSRTAGGYAWGSGRTGGARFFSHGPAAPAQVIHNASQAVRAFFISGKKAQFDGVDPRTGEKRYKTISVLQDSVQKKVNKIPKATPGSVVAFNISPTVTALTPLKAVKGFASFAQERQSLNQEGLLDMLSVDFSRAVKELAAVLNDLQRLSSLGDLPISYESSMLRVHFPGCDSETVESLCNELGVQRGVVQQDEEFDVFVGTEIALLFPFASSRTPSECSFYEKSVTARQQAIDWRNMMSPTPSGVLSEMSEYELDYEEVEPENPWLSSPSGYESISSEIEEGADAYSPLEYQDIEGNYWLRGQCETSR